MPVIGRLDRRIEIQRQVVTRDAFGGVSRDWVKVAQVWARVDVTGASEDFDRASFRDVPQRFAKIAIRWRRGMNTIIRIIYDQKSWDVLGLATYGSRETIVFDAVTDPSRAPVPFT